MCLRYKALLFFVFVISCAYGQEVEFVELLKKIAIPKAAGFTFHNERFLAEQGTFVEWHTEGVADIATSKLTYNNEVVGGLGGLGREGDIFIHFDGNSMTKELRKVVEEVPWHISWSGTFRHVIAVYLQGHVSIHDYIDIVEFLQRHHLGNVIHSSYSIDEAVPSKWLKIQIPGFKPLWMNIEEDMGNSQGSVSMGFVFQEPY